MRWTDFVDHIKTLGFEGNGDDFVAVELWLKQNGHDPVSVDAGDKSFELKELYDKRPGKPMDVSAAAQKAEQQAAIDDGVKKALDEIRDLAGLNAQTGNGKKTPHRHDIKVGGLRVAEDPKGGYPQAGEFFKDVAKASAEGGSKSERLEMWTKATLDTYGSEGVGVDGGFAIPPDFREGITVHVMGEDSILSRCDQYPIGGNTIMFPDDETTPWQTTGGIQTTWEGEASAINQSKPNLKQKELRLRKLTCLVPVTEELLEDSAAMGAYITRKAGEKLDFKIGEAIFRGTGAGQPLGFLNSSALISVPKETNQVANTLVANNVIKMWSRLYGPWRAGAVWYYNQDIEKELMTMAAPGRLNTGSTTTSWGTPVYMPANGISVAPYGTLMGRPAIPTQHAETLGDAGDICLVNMSQYVCAIKSGGIESATSMHLWFDQDVMAFKFRMRIDGQPWMSSTITSRDSTATNSMSAFIIAAAR